jgi:hypothetical protein
MAASATRIVTAASTLTLPIWLAAAHFARTANISKMAHAWMQPSALPWSEAASLDGSAALSTVQTASALLRKAAATNVIRVEPSALCATMPHICTKVPVSPHARQGLQSVGAANSTADAKCKTVVERPRAPGRRMIATSAVPMEPSARFATTGPTYCKENVRSVAQLASWLSVKASKLISHSV